MKNIKTYKTKSGVKYVLFEDMKREALRDPKFTVKETFGLLIS